MSVVNQNKPNKSSPILKEKDFIKVSTVSYSVMAFIGVEICWWWNRNLTSLLGLPHFDHVKSLVLVLAAVLFLHLLQKVIAEYSPSYRKLKGSLAKLIGRLTLPQAAWLAFMSAVGEEILFRGAIQHQLGIFLTSIVFGLLHLDPEEGLSFWTLWSFVAGLVLGGIVATTGSLWPAIVVHFLVNLIGLRSLSKLPMEQKNKQPNQEPYNKSDKRSS